jgi:single-strand DNA-binding protein
MKFYEDTNIVVITGNLTRDPELDKSPKGTPFCNLRVGVNGRRKEGEEWKDKPNFFTVVVFKKDAENAARYLKKGRKVLVEGRLDWSEWGDDDDKREAVKIIPRRVQYLGGGKDSGSSEQTEADETATPEPQMSTDAEMAGVGAGSGEEDIPF